MSKFQKIIHLINLLSHRKYVTFDTIREVCEVSQRTIYRYLNTLSASNIPVYFDPDVRAYRLTDGKHIPVDTMGAGDAVLVAIALGLLSARVNSDYRVDIHRLLKDLSARQDFPLETILASFEHLFECKPGGNDCSELVSSALIQAGVLGSRTIELTAGDKDQHRVKLHMTDPAISFESDWRVVERTELARRGLTISSVKKVNLG